MGTLRSPGAEGQIEYLSNIDKVEWGGGGGGGGVFIDWSL